MAAGVIFHGGLFLTGCVGMLAHGLYVLKGNKVPAACDQLAGQRVAVVCVSCDKPTRVGFRARADGVKVRFCRRCDEDLD